MSKMVLLSSEDQAAFAQVRLAAQGNIAVPFF